MKMFNLIIYLLFILIAFQSCSKNKFSTEFEDGYFWAIKIPDDYTKESSIEVKSRSEREKKAIENSGYYNSSQSENLFYYYIDDFHSISANKILKSDLDKGVPYLEMKSGFKKNVYNMLSENFGNEVLLDSISHQQSINNLTFDVFKIIVKIEGITWIQETYSHNFRDEILQVNLSYINQEEGEKLTRAMKQSELIKK